MSPRHARAACLTVLVLTYVAGGLIWWVSTPLGQGPDEFGHVDYTTFILEHGRLPNMKQDRISQVMTDVRWFTAREHKYRPSSQSPRYSEYEELYRDRVPDWTQPSGIPFYGAGHAPLHYLLASVVMMPLRDCLNPLERWQICRLLSFLVEFGAVMAGYYVGRRAWPRAPEIGGAALAVWMMALPMAQYLRSTAANDSLAMSCAAWLSALFIVWETATPWRSVLMGLILAVGCMAKASVFPFVAVAGLWLLRGFRGWRTLALGGFLVFFPCVAALGAHCVHATAHGGWHYFAMNPEFFRMIRHLEGVCPNPVLEKLGTWRLFFHGYGNMSEVRSPTDLWGILLVGPALVGVLIRPMSSKSVQRAAAILGTVLAVFLAGVAREILSVQRTGFTGRHFLVLQLPLGLLFFHGWSNLIQAVSGKTGPHLRADLSSACLLAGGVLLLNRYDLLRVLQATYFGSFMEVWSPHTQIFHWVCGNLPETLKHPVLWYAVFVAATVLTYGLIVFYWVTAFRALVPARRWRRVIR